MIFLKYLKNFCLQITIYNFVINNFENNVSKMSSNLQEILENFRKMDRKPLTHLFLLKSIKTEIIHIFAVGATTNIQLTIKINLL